MGENLVLGGFLGLTTLLAVALKAIYRRADEQRAGRRAVIAGNLLLTAFLVSALTSAGEVYVRFVYDQPDSFGLTKTTLRWFDRHYKKNVAGLRDDAIRYESLIPAGKRRVTFVGDSFTVGQGVEDVDLRFANLLREREPDWEVHIAAVNGADTPLEHEFLAIAAATGYELDLVVLVFNLNDIAPLMPEWRRIHNDIYERPAPSYLIRESWLLNLMYFRLKATFDSNIREYFDFVQRGYGSAAWEQEQALLREMRDMVLAHGGHFAVVTFPLFHAMAPDDPFREVHEKLGRFWRTLGVPHLDLLSVYEGLPARRLIVNNWDAHPNELAHRMAADAIQAFLEKQLP